MNRKRKEIFFFPFLFQRITNKVELLLVFFFKYKVDCVTKEKYKVDLPAMFIIVEMKSCQSPELRFNQLRLIKNLKSTNIKIHYTN